MRIPGIYPELWKSGRDPVRHQLWLECQRGRAQAKYRGQVWDMSEDEFCDIWIEDNRYKHRGRDPNSLCMTRKDKTLPWRVDNVKFATRREHFREIYAGIPRKSRKLECKR